jgi:hypothetical protein
MEEGRRKDIQSGSGKRSLKDGRLGDALRKTKDVLEKHESRRKWGE